MPILLTYAPCILEVSSPCQTQRPALKVSVGEHVGEAEGVVVLLREELQELLHPIVTRETVAGVLQRLLRVNFDSLDHETDLVSGFVEVEVWE